MFALICVSSLLSSYKTYADEFGKSGHYDDNTFYTDYGQKYDTREFFKHDFNKQVTKFMGGII